MGRGCKRFDEKSTTQKERMSDKWELNTGAYSEKSASAKITAAAGESLQMVSTRAML